VNERSKDRINGTSHGAGEKMTFLCWKHSSSPEEVRGSLIGLNPAVEPRVGDSDLEASPRKVSVTNTASFFYSLEDRSDGLATQCEYDPQICMGEDGLVNELGAILLEEQSDFSLCQVPARELHVRGEGCTMR
jgi:hypothetical protein